MRLFFCSLSPDKPLKNPDVQSHFWRKKGCPSALAQKIEGRFYQEQGLRVSHRHGDYSGKRIHSPHWRWAPSNRSHFCPFPQNRNGRNGDGGRQLVTLPAFPSPAFRRLCSRSGRTLNEGIAAKRISPSIEWRPLCTSGRPREGNGHRATEKGHRAERPLSVICENCLHPTGLSLGDSGRFINSKSPLTLLPGTLHVNEQTAGEK